MHATPYKLWPLHYHTEIIIAMDYTYTLFNFQILQELLLLGNYFLCFYSFS